MAYQEIAKQTEGDESLTLYRAGNGMWKVEYVKQGEQPRITMQGKEKGMVDALKESFGNNEWAALKNCLVDYII